MDFHQFVTRRLQQFADTPRMYGSEEAVELQALQLMELEVLHYAPEALAKEPRIVMEAYLKELGRQTGASAAMLCDRTPKIKDPELVLFDICMKVRFEVGSKLSLNLTPHVSPEGVVPVSATV